MHTAEFACSASILSQKIEKFRPTELIFSVKLLSS